MPPNCQHQVFVRDPDARWAMRECSRSPTWEYRYRFQEDRDGTRYREGATFLCTQHARFHRENPNEANLAPKEEQWRKL